MLRPGGHGVGIFRVGDVVGEAPIAVQELAACVKWPNRILSAIKNLKQSATEQKIQFKQRLWVCAPIPGPFEPQCQSELSRRTLQTIELSGPESSKSNLSLHERLAESPTKSEQLEGSLFRLANTLAWYKHEYFVTGPFRQRTAYCRVHT